MPPIRRISSLALVALLAIPGTAAALEPPVLLADWGTYGSGAGQFINPWGLAVDGSGNVFVADASNHRIQKFTSSGAFVTSWGSNGTGNGQFHFPLYVAIDGAGDVYVTDSENHRIEKFDNSGAYITQWGTTGSGDGEFSGATDGIAVDGSGNVYVCDTGNKRIQKFTSSGTFVTKWGTGGTGDGQFTHPMAIAVSPAGDIYVLDVFFSPGARVQVFSNTGTFLSKWGATGTGDGEFSAPRAIAIDGLGRVYVPDYTLCRVQIFSGARTYLTQWGTMGTGGGQFQGPLGIAADAVGTVFVTDLAASKVKKFGGSSFHFYPTLTGVDWHMPFADFIRFHLRWRNYSLDTESQPLAASLFAEPFGVFMPDGPPVQGFDVPPVPAESFFDVFIDVPLDQLPPSAPVQLPGGGPSAADPCPPGDGWSGNLDVRWAEDGIGALSDWHGGDLLVGPGLGYSYIHVVSDCAPVDSLTWALLGACPGFTATLFEEDKATPAPPSLPAAWHGFLAVAADPGTPVGAVCCFDLLFRCDATPARVHLCANTCTWSATDVGEQPAQRGFGIRTVTPNPAGGPFAIQFAVPRDGPTALEIFDAQGKQVRTLIHGHQDHGSHFEVWDGRSSSGATLPGGVYFIRLSAAGQVDTRKITLAP